MPYTGAFIMSSLGFPQNWTWRPFAILVAFVLIFYGSAALLFTYRKIDNIIAREQTPQADKTKCRDSVLAEATGTSRQIEIVLNKYGLDMIKGAFFWNKSSTKTLVHPITAKFQSGKLNVIIGPSGSGKTSLLNSLTNRLKNAWGTKYSSQGVMLYNGHAPSNNVVRSVTSYVGQNDEALLPMLTVRETLHFAACLRLPTWLPKQDKIRRAEAVMQRLGLKDCADTLVGNDSIEGISGGEKRRVSIATQILTEPQVLLLDEPTSGLDSFTASSIIELLASLAKEGRTILLTIHQPGSNLFRHFDNILVLARGGFPTFSGKGVDMLPYFASIGYDCEEHLNPADFAMDLVTVNLQASEKEASSSVRVDRLIRAWQVRGVSHIEPDNDILMLAELGAFKRTTTPFRAAFPLLVKRSLISFRRDSSVATARISQVLGYGLILTLFFAPLKKDYDSILTRFGFIQELAGKYGVDQSTVCS